MGQPSCWSSWRWRVRWGDHRPPARRCRYRSRRRSPACPGRGPGAPSKKKFMPKEFSGTPEPQKTTSSPAPGEGDVDAEVRGVIDPGWRDPRPHQPLGDRMSQAPIEVQGVPSSVGVTCPGRRLEQGESRQPDFLSRGGEARMRTAGENRGRWRCGRSERRHIGLGDPPLFAGTAWEDPPTETVRGPLTVRIRATAILAAVLIPCFSPGFRSPADALTLFQATTRATVNPADAGTPCTSMGPGTIAVAEG